MINTWHRDFHLRPDRVGIALRTWCSNGPSLLPQLYVCSRITVCIQGVIPLQVELRLLEAAAGGVRVEESLRVREALLFGVSWEWWESLCVFSVQLLLKESDERLIVYERILFSVVSVWELQVSLYCCSFFLVL